MSQANSSHPPGRLTLSLTSLFQMVTASCLFFACLNISPILAITLTLMAAPAIIRTGASADHHRRIGIPFGWKPRILCFFETVGIEFITLAIAGLAFVLISSLFGAAAVGFSLLYGAAPDELSDVAVVGTAGGMIWGMAAAIIAVIYTSRIWKIRTTG